MVNPKLASHMTPQERYECRLKAKVPDAIYNLEEAVNAAQLYSKVIFPNESPLSRNKIRALYLFLFDMIIHSVDRNAIITFTNFGTFRRSYRDCCPIVENIGGKKSFRRAHYRCNFNPSKRFKNIMNSEDKMAFNENSKTFDELYHAANVEEASNNEE